MLLAILAMMIVAALVVPMLMMNNGFHEADERRNAQLLAAVSYRAHEAGVDFVEGAEVGTAVQNLLAGGETPKGRHFQAAGMTAVDATQASRYLKVQNGHLIYQPRK
jgi:hypothetical protein